MRHRSLRSRIAAAAGRLRRGDEGFAIAAVLVLGVCLIALSSVVVVRGTRAVGNTAGDARWERALPAAETGLEEGLQQLELDPAFSTVAGYPSFFASPGAEREWVVAAADAAGEDDLVETPVGEYVVVKPAGVNLLYTVGYSPSRDAIGRRTRVVRVGYELHEVEWVIEYALLVGDGLNLQGNTLVIDTNDNDSANVHANGEVYTGGSWEVQGCLSDSLGDASPLPEEPGCPPKRNWSEEPVASINPLQLYDAAEVVLCLDGKAYGGPAHPDPAKRDPNLIPCDETSDREVPLGGWSSKAQGGVVTWDPSGATLSGVYYVHWANIDGKVNGTATLLISSAGLGTCTGNSTGNLSLAGNSSFRSAPGMKANGYDIAVVTQGDIYYRGGATVQGMIMAHEQIDYRGNSDSSGAVVAEGACNTPGSPVAGSKISGSVLTGSSFIAYPGPVKTPFTSLRQEVEVIAWHEL